MKAKNMFVKASNSDEPGVGTWWGGKGVFVDYTNADTRKYWKELLKEHVLDYGTCSVWNDNCEYDTLSSCEAVLVEQESILVYLVRERSRGGSRASIRESDNRRIALE